MRGALQYRLVRICCLVSCLLSKDYRHRSLVDLISLESVRVALGCCWMTVGILRMHIYLVICNRFCCNVNCLTPKRVALFCNWIPDWAYTVKSRDVHHSIATPLRPLFLLLTLMSATVCIPEVLYCIRVQLSYGLTDISHECHFTNTPSSVFAPAVS